jgi:hypothetical protein
MGQSFVKYHEINLSRGLKAVRKSYVGSKQR